MADEQTVPAVEAINADTLAAPAKRQRAPRRSKEEIAHAVEVKAAKSGRRKLNKADGRPTGKSPTTETGGRIAAVKVGTANRIQRVRADQNATTASDEFTDLMKLEEENKGLRKALAEKLRAENAELRKRLGA